MNDKELLELAAKAAEIVPVNNFESWDHEGDVYQAWNPLTDDGDAFRLAVKLRFVLSPPDPYLNKVYVAGDGVGSVEDCGDDPYAATRRAIVRAAAAIGEMK